MNSNNNSFANLNQGQNSIRTGKMLKQSSSRKALRHASSMKKLTKDSSNALLSSSLHNGIAPIAELISPSITAASAEQIKARLSIKFSFGCNKPNIDPIITYSMTKATEKDKNNHRESDSSDRLVYKIGNQIVVYDPETSNQSYLSDLPSTVLSINHMSISLNHKYLAICQSIRRDKDEDLGKSVISIYNLVTHKLLKTLEHNSGDDYEMTSFAGDSKHLFALLESSPEKELHIYHWEKEKLLKTMNIPITVSRIRGIPSQILGVALSGVKYLRNIFFSPSFESKFVTSLPQSREHDLNFFEQIFLPNQNSLIKQVVLAEYASSQPALPQISTNLNDDSGNVADKSNTPSANYAVAKKQFILIFECSEHSVHSTGAATTLMGTTGPMVLSLELRQTITLKASRSIASGTGMNFMIQGITNCSNGFIISGPFGFIALYDRTDEKRDPYVEVKKFTLGELNIIGVAIYPSEEKIVVLSDSGRLLSVQMDSTVQVNTNNENETPSAITTNAVKDLVHGGYSNEPVTGLSVAFNRPVIATISSDRCFRLYNYDTCKCEMRYSFSMDEQPLALSIHPSGFQVVISFKDRIKLFNILPDKLKTYLETILKACREIHYSNGGQYIAAASGINIIIYDARSLNQMITLQGHMMSVRNIRWAEGDQALFSSGLDGNVYGWIASRFLSTPQPGDNTEINRIEVVAANNRTSTISSIAIDCLPTSFHKTINNSSNYPSNALINNTTENKSINTERSLIAIASLDGNIKLVNWSFSSIYNKNSNMNDLPIIIPGEMTTSISCMCFTSDRSYLIAGTMNGTIRIYIWPQPTEQVVDKHAIYLPSLFSEIIAHSCSVTNICISPNDTTIFSIGEDGAIFIYNFIKNIHMIDSSLAIEKVNEANEEKTLNETKESANYLSSTDGFRYNTDVVLVSTEEIDDHLNEIVALNKQLSDITLKTNYLIQQKEFDSQLEKKTLIEKNESIIYELTDKNDTIVKNLERKINELTTQLTNNETRFIKDKNIIENKYEHKLNEQIDRYNTLMENMTALKQYYDEYKESSESEFKTTLLNLKNQYINEGKRLKAESDRIKADRKAEEDIFSKILQQQEDEYEDELKLLILAADNELTNERSSVNKLKEIINEQKSKLTQMKKKNEELLSISSARLSLLSIEKNEKDKLQETLEHYKHNLSERDRALTEKEKIISDLRNTTRTLENFRFVLDHRLQQLSLERGPITNHIEKLEKHIVYMYEQIVDEFDLKKGLIDETQTKDQKLTQVNKEISQLRYEVTLKERYIASFKRDLETIVSSIITGKELEETIQKLYKRYVKNESIHSKGSQRLIESDNDGSLVRANPKVRDIIDTLVNKNENEGNKSKTLTTKANTLSTFSTRLNKDIEQGLIDTAKEADRQRIFKEREANDLRHRLETLKVESDRQIARLINDNSNILNECNELRKEVKQLELQVQSLKDSNFATMSGSRLLTQDRTNRFDNDNDNYSIPVSDSTSIYDRPNDSRFSNKIDLRINSNDSKVDLKKESKIESEIHSRIGGRSREGSRSGSRSGRRPDSTTLEKHSKTTQSLDESSTLLGRKPSILDVTKAILEAEKRKSMAEFAQPLDTRDIPDTANTITTSVSTAESNSNLLISNLDNTANTNVNNVNNKSKLAPIKNSQSEKGIEKIKYIESPRQSPLYKIQTNQQNKNIDPLPLSDLHGIGIGIRPITPNMPTKKLQTLKKPNKHYDYVVAKLTSENAYLATQLDKYTRENETQKMENSRLKKQLATFLSTYLSNQSNNVNSQRDLLAVLGQSDEQINNQIEISDDKSDFMLQPIAISNNTNKKNTKK